MFSHFTPQTVELLTAVQKAALQEWEATEPDATPLLKAFAEVKLRQSPTRRGGVRGTRSRALEERRALRVGFRETLAVA